MAPWNCTCRDSKRFPSSIYTISPPSNFHTLYLHFKTSAAASIILGYALKYCACAERVTVGRHPIGHLMNFELCTFVDWAKDQRDESDSTNHSVLLVAIAMHRLKPVNWWIHWPFCRIKGKLTYRFLHKAHWQFTTKYQATTIPIFCCM